MSNLKYAILGSGALGGFYGAKLQQAGSEVHFLLHRDYQQVSSFGLIIESKDGDFHLPKVNAYDDVNNMPKCDVVVVALKTTHNDLLPKMLPNLVKEDGVVLVLQNGFGIEAEIAEILGNDKVMGGLCFLCSNKIAPGHIRHLDYGQIKLGEYSVNYNPVKITNRMQLVQEDFGNAGIKIELTEDLNQARWQKLVWNIPYNGLSVILNATTDELMGDIYTRKFVEQLMWEVAVGAKSDGRIIEDSFIQMMLDYTVKMTPYRTSMKIDYDENRPLEVEAIFGNPLRKAQEKGVSLPQIECLYLQLKFLDAKNHK